MKTKNDKPDVPSLNEIVFENRNKEYGAYILRKKYNKSLIFSMIFGCFFISATVITPFALYKPIPIDEKPIIDSVVAEPMDPNQLIEQKIEKPKLDPILPLKLDYTKIEVVDTLSPSEEKMFRSQDELKDSIQNNDMGPLVVVSKKPEVEIDNEDKIIDIFVVNEKPCFGIGCDNEFRGWIAKNIIYPSDAINAGLQGRVYLSFVVEKDGSLSNIEVIKSEDPILSKEAIRVIGLSPKWSPGKINGNAVRVKMIFPITFTLKTF